MSEVLRVIYARGKVYERAGVPGLYGWILMYSFT